MRRSWHCGVIVLGVFHATVSTPPAALAAQGDVLWTWTGAPPVTVCGGTAPATAVAVGPGSVYIGCTYNQGQNPNAATWFVAVEKRRESDGALLWRWTRPTSNDAAAAVIKLLVDSSGATYGSFGDFAGQLSPAGSLVWATPNPHELHDIAIDGSGLYLSYHDINSQWLEKKRLGDGATLWGPVTIGNPVSPCQSVTQGVTRPVLALDASGLYVVCDGSLSGAVTFGDMHTYVQKRDLATGGFLWQNNTGVAPQWMTPVNAWVVAGGLYIAGNGTLAVGSGSWIVEKRAASNGGPVWATSYSPPGVMQGSAVSGLQASSAALFAVGSETVGGFVHRRVEKRDPATGNVVWARTSPDVGQLGGLAIDACDNVYAIGSGGNAALAAKYAGAEPFTDSGMRIVQGTGVISIAAEPAGTLTSPLRVARPNGTVGLPLVELNDPAATPARIATSGGVKAPRRFQTCP